MTTIKIYNLAELIEKVNDENFDLTDYDDNIAYSVLFHMIISKEQFKKTKIKDIDLNNQGFFFERISYEYGEEDSNYYNHKYDINYSFICNDGDIGNITFKKYFTSNTKSFPFEKNDELRDIINKLKFSQFRIINGFNSRTRYIALFDSNGKFLINLFLTKSILTQFKKEFKKYSNLNDKILNDLNSDKPSYTRKLIANKKYVFFSNLNNRLENVILNDEESKFINSLKKIKMGRILIKEIGNYVENYNDDSCSITIDNGWGSYTSTYIRERISNYYKLPLRIKNIIKLCFTRMEFYGEIKDKNYRLDTTSSGSLGYIQNGGYSYISG